MGGLQGSPDPSLFWGSRTLLGHPHSLRTSEGRAVAPADPSSAGHSALLSVCSEIDQWPPPMPGQTLNLPVMGVVIQVWMGGASSQVPPSVASFCQEGSSLQGGRPTWCSALGGAGEDSFPGGQAWLLPSCQAADSGGERKLPLFPLWSSPAPACSSPSRPREETGSGSSQAER